ncbi:hypothetical protein BHE74_00035228 [Ensete ventricosum]|nr:hypothetical protein BHE74_00035228 [Ensete ventricosum]
MHCVVDRLGLFLYGFLFGFKAFFNHEEPTLFAAMFVAPLADHSRSSSLVNSFGAGAWMVVEGAVGLGMASRGAILVLHA